MGVVEKLSSGRSEIYAAAKAIEKAAIELLLERLDRMANSGLSEVKITSGKREAADASEGGEGEQLSAVENWRHSIGRCGPTVFSKYQATDPLPFP